MTETDLFPPDYAAGRRRFRDAASRLGWSVESHPIDPPGPDGEELAIDVARSGGDSDKLLVLSAGVHGVEGLFGSAVQTGLLERWAGGGAPPVRCVFLHAVNPFGFAWLRRFDENNVDPNRNFLLPGEEYAGAPDGYAALDSALNPRRPPVWWEPFALRAAWAILRHGLGTLQQTIASGQYEFPRGLFFGGKGPSQSNRILDANFARWVGGAADVVHLDFHTGLGRWGTCKLLIDDPLSEKQRGRLVDWFGPDSFETDDAAKVGYRTRGGFGRWCVLRGWAPEYLFACAEFGTYGPVKVLGGLRAENQRCHWGDPSEQTYREKRQLMELFVPADAGWRRRVLATSFDLVDRAVKGLAEGS
jgi:hypothetical protein